MQYFVKYYYTYFVILTLNVINLLWCSVFIYVFTYSFLTYLYFESFTKEKIIIIRRRGIVGNKKWIFYWLFIDFRYWFPRKYSLTAILFDRMNIISRRRRIRCQMRSIFFFFWWTRNYIKKVETELQRPPGLFQNDGRETSRAISKIKRTKEITRKRPFC